MTNEVMDLPVQITFHRMDPSLAVEADIHGRVGELEQFFDRMVSCRVVVDTPHRHHHQGRLYHVGIEIVVPGSEIVVGRSPTEHASHEDVYVAIRDAFHAARRQLEDDARRRRSDVPSEMPIA